MLEEAVCSKSLDRGRRFEDVRSLGYVHPSFEGVSSFDKVRSIEDVRSFEYVNSFDDVRSFKVIITIGITITLAPAPRVI